jgi:glycosyltransferase involved in cell wall biosynthesis
MAANGTNNRNDRMDQKTQENDRSSKGRLRIAYLTTNDPKDRRSWSGTEYQMARALEKHCGDLFYVGPLPLFSAKIGKAVQRGIRLVTGKTYLNTHRISVSKKLGKMAEKKMAGEACDVIFSPAGSVPLAHLHTQIPIVYLSDATNRLMVDYYVEFSSMLTSSIRSADRLEQLAIQNAKQLIYPSAWAARSAVQDYGADPESVHVVPFGANMDTWPSREKALEPPPHDKCRLLFVGTNWERKGGEIAFETLLEMERLGVPVELTVVGCRPPERFRHANFRVIPFLNKNNPQERAQLEELYIKSHFFLLPTRAECFSIALCEANAYGLPILSTHTGGLPELVWEGQNGFLLPPEARGDQYAARLREIYNDPNKYKEMRASSREQFETRLNWDAWGKHVNEILRVAVNGSQEKAGSEDFSVSNAAKVR